MNVPTRKKTRTALKAAIVSACALVTAGAIGVGVTTVADAATPMPTTTTPVKTAASSAAFSLGVGPGYLNEVHAVRACAIQRLATPAAPGLGIVPPAPNMRTVGEVVLSCEVIVVRVRKAMAMIQQREIEARLGARR